MPDDPTEAPPRLDYATPRAEARPGRFWVIAMFSASLIVLELLQPRLTPPGWPTDFDYFLMLLLPIGGVVMATCTRLPGWLIGLYGLLGACTFLVGQFSDTRLHLRLDSPQAIHSFVANWCFFIVGAWVFCRVTVVLRRFGTL